MSDINKKVQSLLVQYGFRLIRETRHLVYRNSEGKVFVCSKTPSDYRVSQNMLTRLRLVVASPPRPEFVAISDFEREQAASIIQGQDKFSGLGTGKKKRSNGIGIYYDTPLLPTIEEEAAQKEQQDRARKNENERRTRELSKKEELRAARELRGTKQKQNREEREASERLRETWAKIILFPLRECEEWLTEVLRGGETQSLKIVQPEGAPKEKHGVFVYIKALDKTDEFNTTEESFRGWYPLIVARFSGGIKFYQAHPLSVISSGDEIIYAPWLNPHLPEYYKAARMSVAVSEVA